MQHRAQATPGKVGYIFLRDGQSDEVPMTYAQLDRKARQIANHLRSQMPVGSRVLINHNPGLEYISSFFGCLYASMIAVPVYPPRFNQKLDRLNSIVTSALPAAALTSKQTMDTLRQPISESPLLSPLRWIETDTLPDENPAELPLPTADTLAFLQYTSGSTSDPKGVMLSQGNLMSNLEGIRQAFGIHGDSRGVIWLPPYHDMGLIGGVLEPAYVGFPVVLFSPFAFLQRPFRWLQAVSKYRATTTGGPNFAYELCARRMSDEQVAELDLSSLDLAFCGAEPIRAEMITRFSDRFAAAGFKKEAFYPCYGLAEATLMVSGGAKNEVPVVLPIDGERLEHEGLAVAAKTPGLKNERQLVGCGKEIAGHKVRIVEPTSHELCADGRVGEIWFSGPSVAQGYWQKPEDTLSHFHARIAGDPTEASFLRTGDLGFVKDGEVYVTGRLKDLLIIHGRNLYPQDIELTVEKSHGALKSGAGAAFAIAQSEVDKLVVVQEIERKFKELDLQEVVRAIRAAVMESHGVAPYAISLIEPNSIPLTSSGKIQRHAARKLFLEGELRERGRFLENELQ
ncbi:fatty acyl-AMP ligase [bacterium]|nr:fatty acyl-AMP ligase [bacterium]